MRANDIYHSSLLGMVLMNLVYCSWAVINSIFKTNTVVIQSRSISFNPFPFCSVLFIFSQWGISLMPEGEWGKLRESDLPHFGKWTWLPCSQILCSEFHTFEWNQRKVLSSWHRLAKRGPKMQVGRSPKNEFFDNVAFSNTQTLFYYPRVRISVNLSIRNLFRHPFCVPNVIDSAELSHTYKQWMALESTESIEVFGQIHQHVSKIIIN